MNYSLMLLIPLIWVAIRDFKSYIIPNIAVLLALGIQIALNLNIEAYITPVVVFSLLMGLYWTFLKLKNVEAIGLGDIKWITVLSIGMTGLQVCLWIWIASVIALIFHKLNIHKSQKIPFGVYLSLAYLIILFDVDESILEMINVR